MTRLSPPTKSPGKNLNALADDVLYLVASQLGQNNPAAVLNVAQTSQSLRKAAVPVLYKRIELNIGPGEDEHRRRREHKAFLRNFRDDETFDIARHVRSVVVKSALPKGQLLEILDKIADCGRLTDFSWEVNAHMPPELLSYLESTWPNLAVSVNVQDRARAKDPNHRFMDTRLLSSPLLKVLHYEVYHEGYGQRRSEWSALSTAILSGGSVEKLILAGTRDEDYGMFNGRWGQAPSVIREDDPSTPVCLLLPHGTRLPALTHFSYTMRDHSAKYDWSEEHCQLFHDAIDTEKIEGLEFVTTCPTTFFTHFTSLFPNLSTLKFGIERSSSDYTEPKINRAAVLSAKNFIMSCPSIQHLDIHTAAAGIDILWPAVIAKRLTLKSLVLRPTFGWYSGPEHIDKGKFDQVVRGFKGLEVLAWDVPFDRKAGGPDAKYISGLSKLKLKRLDLFTFLPQEGSAYTARLEQDVYGSIAPPKLSLHGCEKEAVKLMEQISDAQGQPLEHLSLHFARTGYQDRCQPYTMRGGCEVSRKEDGELVFKGNEDWR